MSKAVNAWGELVEAIKDGTEPHDTWLARRNAREKAAKDEKIAGRIKREAV